MRYAGRSRTGFAGWSCIVLAALLGVAVLPTPVLAKPKGAGGKRIAVLPPTDGTPKDGIITAKIASALKKQKIQAVTGGAVKKAAAMGLPSSDADWIALARKLRVDGIVEPAISAGRGKRRVEVVVHNGFDGSVAGRATFTAKGPPSKLAAAAAAGVARKLASTIRDTEPPKKDTGPTVAQAPAASEQADGEKTEALAREPAETMPAPVEEKSETSAAPAKPMANKETEEGETNEEEKRPPEKASRVYAAQDKRPQDKARKLRALEVEIGVRVLQRVFEFTPSSAGATYNEQLLPMPQGSVLWFPFTYAGIFFAGELNPSLKTGSNPAYPTYARDLVVGAQARYPLSVGAIGLSAGYFQHLFILSNPSDPNSPRRKDLVWPDAAYQGVRIAASGRIHLWSFLQIGAEAGYRLVTNPDYGHLGVRSQHYFPNATVNYGMDGSLFLSFAIVSWLEIRGGVDYRRYGFGALVPGPDNTNSTGATGAVDQYLGYTLGLVGVYGGN